MTVAQVSENGRLTFGFKNVNGRLFELKITSSSKARFVDKFTLPTLRQNIVTLMNKYGKKAERIAKTPGHSPFLTGELVDSIKWKSAKRRSFTGLIVGNITVDVPYGRYQEFLPQQPRRLYLHRAMDLVHPAFIQELRNKRVLEDIILGKRKAIGSVNPNSFKG